ncbi:MAG TPA: type II toxin-antitoxin system PemK/MazF family toxin [Planctomycetota bacterium]|nr:type II toxin-antitoxin system PemK/MazF family toxin [Planctomycetota bacterium]
MSDTPRRGDVIWIEFDPQMEHEQAGRRPALVLSDITYNSASGLVLLCPITSKVKRYPFEVAVPNGLRIHGVILCDQIKSFDWNARKSKYICEMPQETINEVLAKALPLLED